jgi:hypothetical protein
MISVSRTIGTPRGRKGGGQRAEEDQGNFLPPDTKYIIKLSAGGGRIGKIGKITGRRFPPNFSAAGPEGL